MTYEDIFKRFENGDNWFKCACDDDYVCRRVPDGYFIKFWDMEEFPATTNNTPLMEALQQIEFITEKEYNDFK